MQVQLNKGPLLKALYLANGIADRKGTNPILANVLLTSAGKDALRCCATDLRISLNAEIAADVSAEGGINVSAKHLYEIIKNLPGDRVELKRMPNHWVDVRAGNAEYKLLGISDTDFPRLPDHQEVAFSEIAAALFAEMIGKTIFAVSLDDSRPHVSGVFLECDGTQARMVSTDGHRLCKTEAIWGAGPVLPQGVIIPRKAAYELRRLLESLEETCDLGVSQGQLFVKAQDVVISVVLVDAQYPPYHQVLAHTHQHHILLDRQTFIDALRRISILCTDKNYSVRFQLSSGSLMITSDNPELGEAQEALAIDYQGNDFMIGFNARYFLDVLGEMKQSKVILELHDVEDPARLREPEGEGYVAVVMPMRI